MKIIRIDRFTGKEEIVPETFAKEVFTNPEQLKSLLSGIPQDTFGFVYQLDLEDKESDYGTE